RSPTTAAASATTRPAPASRSCAPSCATSSAAPWSSSPDPERAPRSSSPPSEPDRSPTRRLRGLILEGEVEVVAVGVHAQHLVGQDLRGDPIQEDADAVPLDHLVAVGRGRRLVDRELDLPVDLLGR